VTSRPRVAPWIALGATPLVPLVSLAPGGRYLLPLVAPLAVWPLFAEAVRRADYRRGLAVGLVWAILLSAGVILFTQVAPQSAGRSILNGEPYRQEMFGWIESGEGKESSPRRFLPEHALHLAGFALLSLVSGGYLGLALGALLTAYMSYFVGSYAASAGLPVLGSLAAWVPWSVVRVVAFVALGTLLARPLLVREWPRFGPRERRWLLWIAVGIATDLAVKSLLAPRYGLFLRSLALAGS